MSRMTRRNIIGRNFPHAYIRKITLQSNSNFSLKDISDPHVKSKKNKITSDNISMDEYTTVTLNIILKDGAYSNSHGKKFSWVNNDFYKKNTVITVAQFESKKAEEFFLKNMKKILKEKKSINGVTIKQIGLSEMYGLKNKSNSDIIRRTKNNNKKKNMITLSIPYRVKFVTPKVTRYLSYFAFTHNRNILNKFGKITNSVVLSKGRTMKTCKTLSLPDNRLWSGETHTGPDGGLFSDRSHRSTSKKLRVNSIPNKKIVDLRNIEKLSQPEKKSFVSLEDTFIENKTSSDHKRNKKHINSSYFTELYMTPHRDGTNSLFFGIDMRKIIRDNTPFASLFDYPTTNSMHTINRMGKILAESKIISFSLKRRKVIKSKSKMPDKNLIKSSDRSIEETIVESRDIKSPSETQLKALTYKISIPREDSKNLQRAVGHVKEIKNIALTSRNNIGIRFFSINDLSSKFLDQGSYQYTLHLNIHDGTVKYMKRRLANLRRERRRLRDYYSEALKKRSYDPIYETFTKQFKNKQKAKYSLNRRPWLTAVAEYVSLLELYRSEGFSPILFSEKLMKLCDLETGTPNGISLMIRLIDNLTSTIQKKIGANISLNKSGKDVASTSGNMTSFSGRAPSNKSVFEIKKEFKEIYEPDIENIAGYEFVDTAGKSMAYAGSGIKTISAIDFAKRIREENQKYFSKSALDGTENNIDLKVASPGGKENVTFSLGDNILNTAYSFLTPSKIYLPGQKIINTTTEKFKINEKTKSMKKKYEDAILLITKINLGKSSGFVREVDLASPTMDRKKIYNDILGKISCIASSKKESFVSFVNPNKLVSKTKNVLEEYTPAKDEIGSSAIPLAYKILQNKLNPKTKDLIQEYDLANLNANFTSKIHDLVQDYEDNKNNIYVNTPHPIKTLPNSIKSVLLSSSKNAQASKINWSKKASINDPGENGYFYMNYRNIMRVEALVDIRTTATSMKKGKKTSSIKNTLWRTITPNLLSQLTTLGTKTLCRLVPYSNKDFNVQQEKNLELPIYNKYFFISFGKEKKANIKDTSKANIYNNIANYEKAVSPPLEYTFSEIISRRAPRSGRRIVGRSRFVRATPKSSTPAAGGSGGGGMGGGGSY